MLGLSLGVAPLLSRSADAASDGTVKTYQKISELAGNFTGDLDTSDWFGSAVAGLGDLDGDGINDLAVGAFGDDDGGGNRGAVWVLFLNADGTVKSHQKITGDLPGDSHPGDSFGYSVANLGDLDGDGVVDLAVGAPTDRPAGLGASQTGAVWVLFLNADGSVAGQQKISVLDGGFSGEVDSLDDFGISVAHLGDLDGAGPAVAALAVGAERDDDGGSGRGAVWILFLNADGTVASHQKISDTQGGFDGGLDDGDLFGSSVAGIGDLDGDGITDLVVGARDDDDGPGGCCPGAVWVLFLNADGTVDDHQKISNTAGGLGGVLDTADLFGSSVGNMGDVDGDGVTDLAVGAPLDDDGGPEAGSNRGAVWVLFLNADGTVDGHQKISAAQGGFSGVLDVQDEFGGAVATLGDLDGDGITDLAVGAREDDDGATHAGAVWVLRLNDAAPPAAPVAVGLNGPAGAGWVEVKDDAGANVDWVRVNWGAYNGAVGETRPAWCDVDGDGRHELVIGLGSYPTDGGWLEIKDDAQSGFAHLAWIRVPWGQYNSTNGETWPACGELDGDGPDEIVAGLGGPAGQGWLYVFDDALTGYGPHPATPGGSGWLQLGWGSYNNSVGEIRPAVGNLDGEGRHEIVLGLAPGSAGWVQILNDAAAGFAPLAGTPVAGGWLQLGWPSYNSANGEIWPAVCDSDGDGNGEVVLGVGAGGQGWAQIREAPGFGPSVPDTPAGAGWFQVAWPEYNAAVGAVHPACGLNTDLAEEFLLGLGSYPTNGGWLEEKDDLLAGVPNLAWWRVDWGAYNAADGLTRPALAR